MDAIELLRWQTKTAYEWLELTVSDVTAEQALWQPPGTANTIAENYAHTVIWADVDINRYFFARAALLEDGWASRFGLDAFQLDYVPLAVGVDWAALREYGRLVHGWIVQLVEGLTQADLDRSFQMVPVQARRLEGPRTLRLARPAPRAHARRGDRLLEGVAGRAGLPGRRGRARLTAFGGARFQVL
jgi:hypothetical protein